ALSPRGGGGRGDRAAAHRLPGRRGPGPRGHGRRERPRVDPAHRADHDRRPPGACGPGRERVPVPHLPARRDRGSRPRPGRPERACGARAGRELAAPGRGLRDQHARSGERGRCARGWCGGRERGGGRVGRGWSRRRRKPGSGPVRRRARGVLAADWLWHKKMFRAALVNLGREVIALVGAYGVYAAALRLSDVAAPGLRVDLVPALFFYCLAYFVIGRLLFYFALIIRGKLEQDERLLILRYECIGYGATVIAVGLVVGTVTYWPPLAWLFVAAVLGALGLFFKSMLEEAIAAEELNKIHAMEAVITSNISMEDSFARIERLAHRLVDWGDFRIYRRQEGALQLAYRGQIGR